MPLKIEDYFGGMRPGLIFVVSLACLAWSGFIGACAPKSPEPAEAATQFYRVMVTTQVRGLPSDVQMKILRPLMSLELDTLIETARHAQLHFIDAHPDEKPPWIEGNLFGSLFEGQKRFSLGEGVVRGDTARIPVHLEYFENEDTVHWTDEAVVVKYAEGWRVSDIRFKAPWDFKPGGGLREILKSPIE